MVKKLMSLVSMVTLLTILAVPPALAQTVPPITGEQQGDSEQVRPGTELPIVAPREGAPVIDKGKEQGAPENPVERPSVPPREAQSSPGVSTGSEARAPKVEQKKELPKTGGNSGLPLLVLGMAGVLLVGGGLLAPGIARAARG